MPKPRYTATPFAIVPEWLIESPAVSDRAVRLYALLRRAADKSDIARRGRHWLSRILSCSIKSVDRAMNELEDIGALTREARHDGHGQTVNAYHLHDLPENRLQFPRVSPPGDPRVAPPGHGSPGPLATGVAPPWPPVSPQEEEESPVGESPGLEIAATPRAPRKRDEIWDELVVVFGPVSNAASRGTRNAAVKLLRESGASPDEILHRVRAWSDHFGDATLTPSALAKHWDTLGLPPARVPPGVRKLADAADQLERFRGRG